MVAGGKCGCWCMSVGKCMKCSCVKAGIWCTDCYPSRLGRCAYQEPVGQATRQKPSSTVTTSVLPPSPNPVFSPVSSSLILLNLPRLLILLLYHLLLSRLRALVILGVGII